MINDRIHSDEYHSFKFSYKIAEIYSNLYSETSVLSIKNMESANVETQSQIIIPTETVTGTNTKRVDAEYLSTQNISLEQLALFNDLYAKLYSGNAFLLQSNLPPIPNLYLFNPFWAHFPPNYPPPTFPAYYFGK